MTGDTEAWNGGRAGTPDNVPSVHARSRARAHGPAVRPAHRGRGAAADVEQQPLSSRLNQRRRAEPVGNGEGRAGPEQRHLEILRLSQDLPIVIEIVDSQEKIDAFLPVLDGMISSGLVTLEKVQVLQYGKSQPAGS